MRFLYRIAAALIVLAGVAGAIAFPYERPCLCLAPCGPCPQNTLIPLRVAIGLAGLILGAVILALDHRRQSSLA